VSGLYHYLMLCTLQGYVLKLASSLSTSTYDYTLPEVQFMANVSYRHFTLRFDVQVGSAMAETFTHAAVSDLTVTCVNRVTGDSQKASCQNCFIGLCKSPALQMCKAEPLNWAYVTLKGCFW